MAYQKKEYTPGKGVTDAAQAVEQQKKKKPGAYQSRWQTDLDGTRDQILNRDPFVYDPDKDALYQQYKDRYIRHGQLAMLDTMGRASELTGGYGNSYAQNVGQQAYHSYLQELNDRFPELYQLALEQYDRDGQALQDRYGMYLELEQQDYGRYRDDLDSWQAEQDRLYDIYLQEQEQDYDRYRDEEDDRYRQHEQERKDALAAAEFAAEMGDYSLIAQYYGWSPEYLEQIQGSGGKGGSGGRGKKDKELTDQARQDLKRKYPSGRVTNWDHWKSLCKLYGESSLYSAGFYYGKPKAVPSKGAAGGKGPTGPAHIKT